MKNARAKRAEKLFFIVKYANLWDFCCRRRRGCLSSLFKCRGQPNEENHGVNISKQLSFKVVKKVTVAVILNCKKGKFYSKI